MDNLRTGFVSPVQDFSLRVIGDFLLNEQLFTSKLGNIDGVWLAYTMLVQSGLERIYFLGRRNSVAAPALALAPLQGRVRQKQDRGYFQTLELVHRELAKIAHLEDGKSGNLVSLWATLADVLYALQTHQPIILFSKLPDMGRIETALPPEVAFPVLALFRSFRDIATFAPTPSFEVDRKHVAIFREILSSRSYQSYANSHDVLADAKVPASQAANMIRKASDLLTSHYRLLNLERILVSVLPLSARLVDLAFQIPGKLGETLGGFAQQWLSNRQRIVLYRCEHVISDLVHYRVDQLLRTGMDPQELASKLRSLKIED